MYIEVTLCSFGHSHEFPATLQIEFKYWVDIISLLQDDQWRPVNFLNHLLLVKFEEEMQSLGLERIKDFSYGKSEFDTPLLRAFQRWSDILFSTDVCFTGLTQNSIQFSKSYIPLCDDMLKMYNPNQHHLVTAAFSEILAAQLRHADKALSNPKFSDQVSASILSGLHADDFKKAHFEFTPWRNP